MQTGRLTSILLLIMTMSISVLSSASANATVAKFPIVQGVLDLRTWNPDKDPLITVEGDAEFYWKKFIMKEAFGERKYIPFPGPWNLKADYPYHGYASVKFHVILPEVETISMQWGWIWTASEVYVDGKLIHQQGYVGRDEQTSVPGSMESWIANITPSSREFDVVVHMSNFDLFLGGHVEGISIGTFAGIQKAHDKKQSTDTFLLGAIFIMSIYHAMLFLLRRQDRSTLYFSLFCLAICSYLTVGSGTGVISMLFDIGFRGRILIYNYSWMLSMPFFGLFTRTLYPEEFSLNFIKVLVGICACFLVFLGSTEVRTFIVSLQFYQFISMLGIIYSVYAIGLAARRRRTGAKAFLIAICILSAGGINDMLMIRGILDTIPLAATSLFIFIFGQSYLLSVRFSRAFNRAEISEAEVRKLADNLRDQNEQILKFNQTLETRVEEQTRDIRSIMEHTPIAIFAIEGEKATIHRDYSLQLEQILEDTGLAGRAILPLLFQGSSLSNDELDQVKQSLNSMLGEPALAFDLNSQMLPISFHRTNRQGKILQYEAVWNPILNELGFIEKVLVALTDVTEVKHLATEAEQRAQELQTIGEILSVKDEVFQRFLRSCKSFNQQNRQLIMHSDTNLRDPEVIKIVFMNMHTMKGGARTLRLKKLSDLFHDLESYYSHLAKQDHTVWDLQLMQRDIDLIDRSLLEYERVAVEKLGRNLTDGMTVVLPMQNAAQGFQELHRMSSQSTPMPAGLLGLYSALQDALFLPLPTLMEDIFSGLKSLAKDLDKPEPRVHIDLPALFIRVQVEELLRNTFVHLLRNSLDHGIEVPLERSSKGKEPSGLVQLTGHIDQGKVILFLEDDGNGLNLKRLESLGRERKLLQGDVNPSRETCAELMFTDGVSTARSITTISGRGIGMAAVRSYIQEVGGNVQVEFKEHGTELVTSAPFRLRIELPLRLFSTRLEAIRNLDQSA